LLGVGVPNAKLHGEWCQDGPAARAGVIAGDQLISIDGPHPQPSIMCWEDCSDANVLKSKLY